MTKAQAVELLQDIDRVLQDGYKIGPSIREMWSGTIKSVIELLEVPNNSE